MRKKRKHMKLDSVGQDYQISQNIQEITVPDQMMQRIKTGIGYIDEVFGEGFTPGTCGFITGGPGAGKSSLMLTVANALAEQDVMISYNSTEEHVFQLKYIIDRFGFENPFLVSNNADIDDVLEQAKKNNVKVLFLDSLQTMGCEKYEAGTRKAMRYVVNKTIAYCKKNYIVGIIIGQITKQGAMAGPQTLKHAGDWHMHLYNCVKQTCLDCEPGTRTIVLEKNRFGPTNISKRLMLFREGFKEIPS